MPSTREYRRIFRRLFVTHLGLALLPLVALGIFSIDRINSIYDEKISAGIEAVCSSKHRALDTFLHERVSQIKTLAFTHDLAELRDPDRLSRIFTVMQQSGRSFVDLGIIGMDGRHISYVGPFDLRDANYVNAPWFTEVLRKGVFVSDVFMGFRNVPHFIIAVLRHEGGESFIMRATIDMEAINGLLQRVYSGERSDAFLINEQGVLQTDSRDYGRILEHFDVTLPNVLRQGIALVPLPSQPGDSGSKEPLAAMMHLDAMPWLLLGAVPGSFAGVYLLQICSGAVLQGIVGILLLFFVYWQLYVHGGRGGGARLQPVGVACGFGAGLLGTGIALDGPPMAAFGLAVGWEPRVFLGTVSVFFMLRGIITLVLQWWHGFFTPEVLGMALYGTPGVMLGSLAAFPVVKRINVLLFRSVLLAIIAICGVVCLVRSIW